MAGARRGVGFHSTTCCIAFIVLTIGACVSADDVPPGQSIQRVPADNPGAWPEGEWTPVPRSVFQQYVQQRLRGDQATAPAGSFIERIEYRGTLEGLSFDGEFTAAVNTNGLDSFLDLQQVSMYLGDLHWDAGSAEWGTADDGRFLLLSAKDNATLSGHWSLAHREVGDRIEYCVRAPAAASTRFELTLPAGWKLDSSAGSVIPPAGGATTWVVELGQRHECLWTLVPADAPELQPLMLSERSLVYSVGPEQCQVHAEFDVRVLRGPVRELRFELPDGFEHSTTTYRPSSGFVAPTGNIPLTVRQEESQGRRTLIVPDLELDHGVQGTIEIDGTSLSVMDASWTLPTISLSEARRVRSTRRLRVEVPLAVAALEPVQLRQTGATFNETDADWFFEELSDDAELTVQLGDRKPRFSTRIVARVEQERDDLRCDTLVRLQTHSGAWYATEFELPADWDVFDVLPAPGAGESGIAYWRVLDEESDAPRLRVEFRQAASIQSVRSILIRSRSGRRGSMEPALSAPAPAPVSAESDDSRVLIVIPPEYSLTPDAPGSSAWSEVQSSALDATSLQDLEALGVDTSGNRAFRCYKSMRAPDPAHLIIPASESSESVDTPVGASATATVQPDSGRGADEIPEFSLLLKSHLSAAGTNPDWHEAVFHVIAGRITDTLSFRLLPEFNLDSVWVNGQPADYTREGDQIVLSGVAADVRTIEIRYSQTSSAHGLLSQHQLRVAPPDGDHRVTSFCWQVFLPRSCSVSRVPRQAFINSLPRQLSVMGRLLGPFFRVDGDATGSGGLTGPATDPESGGESGPEQGVVTFLSMSPPEVVGLEVWNRDVARTYAWVAFMGATLMLLLVRLAARRFWRPVALTVICVAGVLSTSLTTVPAILCGGVFLGSVLAVAMPDRLIRFPLVDQSSPVGPGLRPQGRWVWTGLWLLATLSCLLTAALCPADDDLSGDGAANSDQTLRILAPYNDRGEAADVVYVDSGLARQLARWRAAAESRPRWLLRGARYVVPSVPSEPIRADIDVLVPADRETVRVLLPLEGVTFRSTEDCLVDGVPAPLRPSAGGAGLIVEVTRGGSEPEEHAGTAFRTVEITLHFRPAQVDAGAERRVMLPVILDSRLEMERSDKDEVRPEVLCMGATSKGPAGWEMKLGPVGALGIQSSGEGEGRAQQFSVSEAVSLFDLRPGQARVRSRLLVHRPLKASERDSTMPLVLELPGLCEVREVAAEHLKAFYVRYPVVDRTVVEIVFDEMESDDTVIRLDYQRPAAAQRRWSIPGIFRAAGVAVANHLVGITTSRGLQIDTSQVVSDAEGVKIIAPETFLERVPGDVDWPAAPDVAYQLTSPVELPIEINPLESERSTEIEQTLLVGEDRTTWEARLSMTVAVAPATQHRLELPSEVQVESVSVVQDDAKRLLNWSQNGDSLAIFLAGDRTGFQEILLKGRYSAAAGTVARVPVIRVPGATIWKSETVIGNRSHQVVEFLDANGAVIGELMPADADAEAEDDIPQRRFETDDPAVAVAFRTRPPRTAPTLEAAVAISPEQIAVGFRPVPPEFSRWDVEVPEAWGGQFEVEPPEALIEKRIVPAGRTVLSLLCRGSAGVVTLSTPTEPPAEDQWTIALPDVVGADIIRTFVAASADVPFVPDGESVEIDSALQSWVNAELSGRAGPTFSCLPGGCTLTRVGADDRAVETPDMIVETLLFSNIDRPGDGRTSAILQTDTSELSIDMRVPAGVELLHAEINGRPLTPEWADERTATFSISSRHPLGLSQFVVYWRSSTSSGVGATSEMIPRLIAPHPQDEALIVVPAGAHGYIVRDGIATMSPLEFHLSSAERLSRILTASVSVQADVGSRDRAVIDDIAAALSGHLQALAGAPLAPDDAARLAAVQRVWNSIPESIRHSAGAVDEAFRSRLWTSTPARLASADPDLVLGRPSGNSSVCRFVSVNPTFLPGMTVAAVVFGLLSVLALVRRFIPAGWRRYRAGRESYAGLVLVGLLWWLLLPLGPVGLSVAIVSLIVEIGSILRAHRELRPAV